MAVSRRNSAPAREPSDEALATLAKALGHPARIGIIRLLIERQSCIGCDIVDQVQLAQSTVSEHLRILKAAGVIMGEIERPRVCYSLNAASLLPLLTLLNGMIDRNADRAPVAQPESECHSRVDSGQSVVNRS